MARAAPRSITVPSEVPFPFPCTSRGRWCGRAVTSPGSAGPVRPGPEQAARLPAAGQLPPRLATALRGLPGRREQPSPKGVGGPWHRPGGAAAPGAAVGIDQLVATRGQHFSAQKLPGTAVKDTKLPDCSSSPRRSCLEVDLEAFSMYGSRAAI